VPQQTPRVDCWHMMLRLTPAPWHCPNLRPAILTTIFTPENIPTPTTFRKPRTLSDGPSSFGVDFTLRAPVCGAQQHQLHGTQCTPLSACLARFVTLSVSLRADHRLLSFASWRFNTLGRSLYDLDEHVDTVKVWLAWFTGDKDFRDSL
jgi:hypothetical protein